MKNKKLIFDKLLKCTLTFLLLSTGFFAFGQISFEGGQIKKLHITGFNVKLSPQGDKLLYSDANFGSLRLYDIKTQKDIKITDQGGSGYQARISNDRVYYKPKYADQFIAVSFDGQQIEIVDNIQSKQAQLTIENDQGVTARPSEDLTSIVVSEGHGKTREIAPLGKKNYLNVSVSPDGKKLLFRVSGMSSFVSTLDGQIIKKFEDAEFPSWLNNEEILYAEVEDDGYNYLSSDLYVEALDSDQRVNITTDVKVIALYPSAAQDVVAFNTPKGDIYLIIR